ncbi:hypothetical protein GW17_00002759 [Ensete ventricosum]|nr:hypothetical protein GW17_00002759 [Ensete ventricosum]
MCLPGKYTRTSHQITLEWLLNYGLTLPTAEVKRPLMWNMEGIFVLKAGITGSGEGYSGEVTAGGRSRLLSSCATAVRRDPVGNGNTQRETGIVSRGGRNRGLSLWAAGPVGERVLVGQAAVLVSPTHHWYDGVGMTPMPKLIRAQKGCSSHNPKPLMGQTGPGLLLRSPSSDPYRVGAQRWSSLPVMGTLLILALHLDPTAAMGSRENFEIRTLIRRHGAIQIRARDFPSRTRFAYPPRGRGTHHCLTPSVIKGGHERHEWGEYLNTRLKKRRLLSGQGTRS